MTAATATSETEWVVPLLLQGMDIQLWGREWGVIVISNSRLTSFQIGTISEHWVVGFFVCLFLICFIAINFCVTYNIADHELPLATIFTPKAHDFWNQNFEFLCCAESRCLKVRGKKKKQTRQCSPLVKLNWEISKGETLYCQSSCWIGQNVGCFWHPALPPTS